MPPIRLQMPPRVQSRTSPAGAAICRIYGSIVAMMRVAGSPTHARKFVIPDKAVNRWQCALL